MLDSANLPTGKLGLLQPAQPAPAPATLHATKAPATTASALRAIFEDWLRIVTIYQPLKKGVKASWWWARSDAPRSSRSVRKQNLHSREARPRRLAVGSIPLFEAQNSLLPGAPAMMKLYTVE